MKPKQSNEKRGRLFGAAPLFGIRFMRSIARAMRNNRGKHSLDVSSAKSPGQELVKINLNPRISAPAIRNSLEKVGTTRKGWISTGLGLWQRLVECDPLYLRAWIRARQKKIMVRLWCNLHGIPREQYESMAVERRTVMNPHLADRKRHIFRLIDERHTKDTTTMVWIADACGLDTEWESLLYDRKPETDKLSNPRRWVYRLCHIFRTRSTSPNDQYRLSAVIHRQQGGRSPATAAADGE